MSQEALGRGDLLVVDDTTANLRLLAQVLQGAGYRVRLVTTGGRALAIARQAPPALVLLDLRLPDIDGVTVCQELKRRPQTAGIPVIFISAFDDPEAKVNAFAAGGVDYVVKPINADEVLARVATHLALRELHQQLSAANVTLQAQLSELAEANIELQQQIRLRRAAEEATERLLNQERRRAQRLVALRDAMTAISGALDLASVRETVLQHAALMLGARWGALAQILPSGERMRVAALYGLPPGLMGMVVPLDSGLIGEAVARQRVVSARRTLEPLLRAGIALAAPMFAGETLEGVLVVASPSHSPDFSAEDEQLLELFAQQAATALQNARLFEEVRHLARTDPLTGLYNRRHFFELAQREIERVRRAQGAVALMMLDVDHFKQVNDVYGHQAGDAALHGVADLLRASLRAADVSARFGGEEIVVLLPDTNLERAFAVAERLRAGLARMCFASERGTLAITASFGVTAIDEQHQSVSLDTLIARADEACYAAKETGRDRVVVWSESLAAPRP